ncbi:hypothetical protein NC652_025637 [Populus alba x Populus x berolinensis]|nr:hypothetical protein NC652_025637 [Populus alba x Populus x berolinensis]
MRKESLIMKDRPSSSASMQDLGFIQGRR